MFIPLMNHYQNYQNLNRHFYVDREYCHCKTIFAYCHSISYYQRTFSLSIVLKKKRLIWTSKFEVIMNIVVYFNFFFNWTFWKASFNRILKQSFNTIGWIHHRTERYYVTNSFMMNNFFIILQEHNKIHRKSLNWYIQWMKNNVGCSSTYIRHLSKLWRS
jgi:hypothetical protein